MFYCEFCEISNNTFFTEHLRMTASVSGKLHIDNLTLEIDSTIGIISEKRHVRKMCQIVCWLAFIIYAKPCAKQDKYYYYPFKRQYHKMVKRTQTIRRQITDELFECVWPFCGVGA